MEQFRTLSGSVGPLAMVNVDTDMIIPKQYLKNPTRIGLGCGFFHELRYLEYGSENAGFVLNQPLYRGAPILLTGDNFGCGSSREQAPWALLDHGIRCVVSSSFADIFYSNCLKNGILPVCVEPPTLPALFDLAAANPPLILTVDLERQEVLPPDGVAIQFQIDASSRDCLLRGVDFIELTLKRTAAIKRYELATGVLHPWL